MTAFRWWFSASVGSPQILVNAPTALWDKLVARTTTIMPLVKLQRFFSWFVLFCCWIVGHKSHTWIWSIADEGMFLIYFCNGLACPCMIVFENKQETKQKTLKLFHVTVFIYPVCFSYPPCSLSNVFYLATNKLHVLIDCNTLCICVEGLALSSLDTMTHSCTEATCDPVLYSLIMQGQRTVLRYGQPGIEDKAMGFL